MIFGADRMGNARRRCHPRDDYRGADPTARQQSPKRVLASNEDVAAEPLKDVERGFVGRQQRAAWHEEGLFEGKLSGEHGVAHHIGEHHPARTGREFVKLFRAGLLKTPGSLSRNSGNAT